MFSIAKGIADPGVRRLAALALSAAVAGGAATFFTATALAVPATAASPASSPAASVGLKTAHVHMHDIAFLPQSLTIAAGTTVVWTNDDDTAHTVTSGVDHDDGAWKSSPLIPPGGTFRLTLTKPGTYRYYCKPHVFSPAMHATIVVTGTGGAATTAP